MIEGIKVLFDEQKVVSIGLITKHAQMSAMKRTITEII
ncbi:hypothetical protein BH18THE1_BH18THE1_04460 [soil metagenome]